MRCYSTVFLKMKILRYIPWYTHSGLNDYVKLIDKCAEGCTIDAAHGSCLLPSWVIGNCTFVPDVSSHHWSPDILEHLWFIYMGHMGMSENWEYSWEWQLYREINDDKPSNVRRYIFRQTHIYADFFPTHCHLWSIHFRANLDRTSSYYNSRVQCEIHDAGNVHSPCLISHVF